MNIREANIADAEIISQLAQTTFDETFGHLFPNREVLLAYFEKTFSLEKIQSSIQKENNVFWVAFVEDIPVGYAKLKIHSPSQFIAKEKIGQLQKIYVLKEYLSMKIGLELQNTLLQKAKELGREYIWLSVYKENSRAINFYKKNAFNQIGKHQFQIGPYVFDFIAMSLLLS